MDKQIKKIINNHCKQIKDVDHQESIARIVKSIDGVVQNLYKELYVLRDGREILKRLEKKNKGHCC